MVNMNGISEVVKALSSLCWPLVTVWAIKHFSEDIKDILRRIKKAKILGSDLELRDKIEKLDQKVEEAASTVVVSLNSSNLENSQPQARAAVDVNTSKNEIKNIIEDATKYPKAALLLLSSEIEREARLLLASMGLLRNTYPVSFLKMIGIIIERKLAPVEIIDSVKMFWDIRNKLVHGIRNGSESEDDLIKIIDIGLRILEILKSIPHEINIIYHPGVYVYEDRDCKFVRKNILGVMLETVDSTNNNKFYRIFPTTREDYRKGERVSWEWNMKLVVGESWYKHPETGQISIAWSSAAEFVGNHLNDL
jgi:hypothetical protein